MAATSRLDGPIRISRSVVRPVTPTIAPKSHINRPAKERGKCVDSNLPRIRRIIVADIASQRNGPDAAGTLVRNLLLRVLPIHHLFAWHSGRDKNSLLMQFPNNLGLYLGNSAWSRLGWIDQTKRSICADVATE